MSLKEDLIRINDALSAVLLGINEELGIPAANFMDLMFTLESALSAREEEGKRALLESSKYLRGTAVGTMVTVDDVSPVPHTVTIIPDDPAAIMRVRGKNWFGSSLTHGGLAGANGNTYASRARLVTDFLAVEPGMTYIFSGIGDLVLASRHAYDKNKKWLKMFGADAPNTVTVPDGAAYIRVHFTKPDNTQEFSDDEVREANELPIQLELGTTATDYVPYTYTECNIGEPIPSVSPIMTVTTDTAGTTVSVNYYRDIDTYIERLKEE